MANLENIRVTVYRKTGSGDEISFDYVTSELTDVNGAYSLSGLSAGTYRLKFSDSAGAYLQEYWDNKATLELATDIVVTAAQTVTGKNAVLGASAYIEGTVTDA